MAPNHVLGDSEVDATAGAAQKDQRDAVKAPAQADNDAGDAPAGSAHGCPADALLRRHLCTRKTTKRC